MAVNSSVEKQPVDQQASGEVQAEIDTRSDGVSPMPTDVSKHNDVSKHPVASIPESTLSLADIERKRSHPALWLAYALLVIAAIVVPYWWGRAIAVNDTQWLLDNLSALEPRGAAFVAWTVTLIAVSGLGLLVVDAHRRLWGAVFVIGLAAEQLIAGLRILKIDFWYATYVVYGESSALANAANLGIISVGIGVAVFAVLWVGLLVTIKKESPLNVLTRSWASFIFFL